jgi:hypothetical protein
MYQFSSSGMTYFTCRRGHGVFAPGHKVQLTDLPSTVIQVPPKNLLDWSAMSMGATTATMSTSRSGGYKIKFHIIFLILNFIIQV